MVLPARRQARLPAFRRRLRGDRRRCQRRTRADRARTAAPRHRRRQHQRGGRLGRPDYLARGCGMGAEATLYLLERGVRLTGTDGWSWDAPFVHTAKRYAQTHDPSIIWEGHKAGRHIGYCHIEKLHNLESLPSTGFTVSCFPVKIERASAGWTRAVAIVEE